MTGDFSHCRVLLFQETGGAHSYIMNNLRACGLQEITGVDDLGSAINNIIAKQFDLIMVTHYGKAREASRLLEEVKSHDATSDIPIMAVAKRGTVKDILRILAKGVDEVMVEPMSQQDVEAKLRKVLYSRTSKDASRQQLEQAKALVERGMLAEAEVIYRDFLADPRLAFGCSAGLFEISMKQKDWPEAQRVLKEASDMAKASEDEVDLQRNMAQVFYLYGNYYQARKLPKKAAKSYKTALKLDPFNLDNMVALLGQLQRDDDLDATLDVIREAASSFLPYSQALETIAQAVAEMGQNFESLGLKEEAATLYRELAGIAHEDIEVHLKVADFFIENHQAELLVTNLLETCQRIKDAELLERLGGILLADADILTKAGFVGPKNSKLPADPASQSVALAKQVFHQAMLLEPDQPEHRLNLATCELRLGNMDAAAEVLSRVFEAQKENLEVYHLIISALLDEKAFDLAEHWVTEAVKTFPMGSEVAKLQARFFKETGQSGKAITALKKGLASAPDDTDILKALGESYLESGEASDAGFYLEKAAKLDPHDDEVKKLLNRAMA